MPKVDFEPFNSYPEFQGLFVGGCVDRGDGSSFRAQAHAHSKQPNKGWICVRAARRVWSGDKPSALMLHELAHLLTGEGHTDKWRTVVRQLGGKVNFWETKEYHIARKAGYRPRSLRETKDCLRTIKRQNRKLNVR